MNTLGITLYLNIYIGTLLQKIVNPPTPYIEALYFLNYDDTIHMLPSMKL